MSWHALFGNADDADVPLDLMQRPGDTKDTEVFHCHFAVSANPPSYVVVYCPSGSDAGKFADISVLLEHGTIVKHLGSYTLGSGAICCAVTWTKKELGKEKSSQAGRRMGKLVVEIRNCNVSSAAATPTATKKSSAPRKSTSPGNVGSSAPTTSKRLSVGSASKSSKRRRKSNAAASDSDNDDENDIDGVVGEISQRWGHTMNAIGGNKYIVVCGQGCGHKLSTDTVWTLSVGPAAAERSAKNTGNTLLWSRAETAKTDTATLRTRMGHAAAVDSDTANLYVFGGAKYKRFFNDVNVLVKGSSEWTIVKPTGGTPPTCSYHSCTVFRGALYVFGGVYPKPDPTPDISSNKLHVFNLADKNWYEPSLFGESPCPRSGHSATLVEYDLVIFGGWDQPDVFNDTFVLDMTMLEFSKLAVSGDIPAPRSWHVAIAVPVAGKRYVFVHGGFDGDTVMGSAYVLDLDTCVWSDVSAAITFPPRAGHAVALEDDGESLVFFGGGDNEGHFFSDVHVILVSNVTALLSS